MYLCSGTKKTTFTKKNHSWTSDLEMHAWKRRFHLQRNHVQFQFCFLHKAMWSFLFFFLIKLFSDIQLNSKLNWSTHFFFWTNVNTIIQYCSLPWFGFWPTAPPEACSCSRVMPPDLSSSISRAFSSRSSRISLSVGLSFTVAVVLMALALSAV